MSNGRHEAAQLVREAIAAFLAGDLHVALHNHRHRIDEHARSVLERLANSGRPSDRLTAAQAIVSGVPRKAWDAVFADCIIGKWKAQHHKGWISEARTVLARSIEADKAVNRVGRFLQSPRPASHQSSGGPIDEALAVLRHSIGMRRRLAKDHLRLYSRKTTVEAARALGIGWIRDSLESIGRRCGFKLQPQHIAAIATAALDLGDVTENAVRKAPEFSPPDFTRYRARSSGRNLIERAD